MGQSHLAGAAEFGPMRVVSRLELHDAPTGAGTVVGAGGALAVCASCMRTKSSSLVRCLGSTMCLCDATLQGQRPLCDFSLQSSVFCVASSIEGGTVPISPPMCGAQDSQHQLLISIMAACPSTSPLVYPPSFATCLFCALTLRPACRAAPRSWNNAGHALYS
jgi:hypothetical protein